MKMEVRIIKQTITPEYEFISIRYGRFYANSYSYYRGGSLWAGMIHIKNFDAGETKDIEAGSPSTPEYLVSLIHKHFNVKNPS
jgi:hypothetical protein